MSKKAPLSDLIASSQTREEIFVSSIYIQLQKHLKAIEMYIVRIKWQGHK